MLRSVCTKSSVVILALRGEEVLSSQFSVLSSRTSVASGGLGLLVLLEPLLGLTVDGRRLILGHLIAENQREISGKEYGGIFDVFARLAARDDGPEIGFVQVFGKAVATAV